MTIGTRSKKVELSLLLSEIKSGLNPAKIVKKYNIPKTTLSYSLGKLKELGCIRKVGYGTWEFLQDIKEVRSGLKGSTEPQLRTSQKREIRGHAFVWKIEFTKPYDWENLTNLYKKRDLTFQRICQGKVFRTIYNNRKIWLTKKGMTIYEPIDFMGRSSFEVKGVAVFEMDKLVKGLIVKLEGKVRLYRFTTSREHYGIVKNELARQYNDRKEKMHIRGEDGTVWMWIDDSKGLGELENADPEINRGVQNFWNDHKKHNFKVTPTLVMEAIHKNTKNLDYHAENMRSHVEAVKKLGEGVESQTEIFKKILNLLEKR